MNRSITMAIAYLFQRFGVEHTPEGIQGFLDVLSGFIQVFGIVVAWYGRWRHKDVGLFGKRIEQK